MHATISLSGLPAIYSCSLGFGRTRQLTTAAAVLSDICKESWSGTKTTMERKKERERERGDGHPEMPAWLPLALSSIIYHLKPLLQCTPSVSFY
jgi:hypothetical protein